MKRFLLSLALGLAAAFAIAQSPPQKQQTSVLPDGTEYGLRLVGFEDGMIASGTKCEFNVETIVQAGWDIRDIWVRDVKITLGDEVIENDPLYLFWGTDVPRFFRFSSLKWNHNTPIPIKVEATFEYIEIGVGLVTDTMTMTVTPKAWNVLGMAGNKYRSEGFAWPGHIFNSQTLFNGHSLYWQNHFQAPTSAEDTFGYSPADLKDKIKIASVFSFHLHGTPLSVQAPDQSFFPFLLELGNLSVQESISAKLATDPIITIVLADSCSTLGQDSTAAQSWGISGLNKGYLGFVEDAGVWAFTRTGWDEFQAAKEANPNATVLPWNWLTSLSADWFNSVSRRIADLGQTIDFARLETSAQEYVTITWPEDDISGICENPVKLVGDDLTTAKFVYLEANRRNSNPLLNQIYWIKLS